MPARSALVAACLAVAALLCTAAPAAASPNARAFFERQGDDIRLFIEVTENSMQFFELTMPDIGPGIAGIQALTPGNCQKTAARRAKCDLAFPAKTGDTTGATIETEGPFPDDGGAELKLCSDSACGPGLNRTIAVTGPAGPGGGPGDPPPNEPPPPPPGEQPPPPENLCYDGLSRPCADIRANIGVLAPESPYVPPQELAGTGAILPVYGNADNGGWDDAANVFGDLEVLSATAGLDVIPEASKCVPNPLDVPLTGFRRAGTTAECDASSLQGGRGAFAVLVNYVARVPGVYTFRFAAGSTTTRDPGPRPNVAELQLDVPAIPDSTAKRPDRRIRRGKPGDLRGSTQDAAKLFVALAREAGGRVATSSRKSSRGCRWLKSTLVKFRRERGAACDEPEWLEPKGTKRWRLTLRKGLPRGRYTLLTRAVGETGAIEAGHSTKDGNRITFRVRRKRSKR